MSEKTHPRRLYLTPSKRGEKTSCIMDQEGYIFSQNIPAMFWVAYAIRRFNHDKWTWKDTDFFSEIETQATPSLLQPGCFVQSESALGCPIKGTPSKMKPESELKFKRIFFINIILVSIDEVCLQDFPAMLINTLTLIDFFCSFLSENIGVLLIINIIINFLLLS